MLSPSTSSQLSETERVQTFPCYVQNCCPFPETEARGEELKNNTLVQKAFYGALLSSRQAYSPVNIPRTDLVHPEDICMKGMLTLFAEDMCEIARIYEAVGSLDRQDISQLGFLTDYFSLRGTLFQRSAFLFVKSIQEINRKYCSNGFYGFGEKCSDIINDLRDCETFEDFLLYVSGCRESRIHFTLHLENPVDVCWDFSKEETRLNMKDCRKIVHGNQSMSFENLSDAIDKCQIDEEHAGNFLYPLGYRSMALPFFHVSEITFRNRLPALLKTRIHKLLQDVL